MKFSRFFRKPIKWAPSPDCELVIETEIKGQLFQKKRQNFFLLDQAQTNTQN